MIKEIFVIMEDFWKWLITIASLLGGVIIWFYKFRGHKAKALKAEIELKKLEDERRINNEAEKNYSQVLMWLKKQKQGLNTRCPISLEDLKKNLPKIDKKVIERVWELLIEKKEIIYKTAGFEGYYILP